MQRKTELQQKRIRNATDAPTEFLNSTDDRYFLVLVPDSRNCLDCCLTVPSGAYSILHRCGKDENYDQLATPGLTCSPCWNRVAYCVSKQACTYNAPVKSCPTADNVMVDCDLTLVFSLGPRPADIKNFVYKLGAVRFGEFLSAAVEESIRHLIRTCLHTEVYELRGGGDERVLEMLEELNQKFRMFGVSFSSAAITDIRFKKELQDTLQKTTEFKSMMDEQEKKQNNQMDQINYRKIREMAQLDKENARVIQDLAAKRERAKIDRTKIQVETHSAQEVALTNERAAAKVQQDRAVAAKGVAQAQGNRVKEEKVADALAQDREMRIRFEQDAKTQKYDSEQALVRAQARADALRVEAEAEESAANSLKIRREHDLRMKKMSVMQALARNSNIVISGESGDRLINQLLSHDILGKADLDN